MLFNLVSNALKFVPEDRTPRVRLAIAQKAAERMNGTIGLESTPGVASRFWFELPKSVSEARVPARP